MSGPNALRCIAGIFHAGDGQSFSGATVSTAVPGVLRLPAFATELPCTLYYWPTKRSYTGQAVAELHTLGSPPILEAVLQAVLAAGARPAEPGEFTLRAFLCGRIDLVQAEAVLGVIDAADPQQLDVALMQLAGGLAGPLTRLRDTLLEMLARLEADLDFPDEDLPALDSCELRQHLTAATELVCALLAQMHGRLETAARARVVLVGAPNVGKSSLFNALAGRQAALTSHLPGTTRDYLTVDLDLDGLRCQLIDTAGMEALPNSVLDVAQAAQQATADQSRQADLRVVCLDASRPLWEQETTLLTNLSDRRAIIVLTKSDAAATRLELPVAAIATSSVTGQGLSQLRRELYERLATGTASELGVVPGTAARCRHSLRHAAECLQRARELLVTGHGEELLAAELRIALSELGRVTGAIYTDDILDRIFSRFCIGK